jgi:hypothetical protein
MTRKLEWSGADAHRHHTTLLYFLSKRKKETENSVYCHKGINSESRTTDTIKAIEREGNFIATSLRVTFRGLFDARPGRPL